MINNITTKRIAGFTVVLMGMFLLVSAGRQGQNIALAEPVVTEPDKKNIHTELMIRERTLKKRFEKLTHMMQEVARLLAKTEPEASRAIKQAVDQAQQAFIDDDMDKVISNLSKGLTSMAGTAQANVVEELKKVLKTLQSSPLSAEAMNEDIRKWSKFLDDVNELKEREKGHLDKARMADKGREFAKQFRELGKKLDSLIKREEKMLQETKGLPSAKKTIEKLSEARREIRKLIKDQEALAKAGAKATPGKLLVASELQKDLKVRSGKLTQKLDKIGKIAGAPAKAAKSAAKDAKNATGQMGKAADKLAATNARAADEHQEQAIADLKAAEKKLTEAIEKMSAPSKASGLAKEQKKLAGDTSELSKAVKAAEEKAGTGSKSEPGAKSNLDKASGNMSKASSSLGEQDKKSAAEQQKKALEQMRKEAARLKKLAKELEDAAKKADLARQAEAQKATAKRTAKTAKDMKDASKQGQPTPGQKAASDAAKSMQQAAGKLGQGNASAASSKQGQAVKQLEKAAEELERAIDEAKVAAQEETLAKIEQILKDALGRQKEITKKTDETYKKRSGDEYERQQVLDLAALSDGEGELAEKIDGALTRIRAEGTTAVFPMVLDEVHEDLANVQNLLAKKKAGPLTQSVQKGIEENLEELVDALQKEMRRRKKKKKGGGSGSGGGGGKPPPLVPPVAELKMLRSLQVQINRRTLVLDAGNRSGEVSKVDMKIQHKIIAKRESRLVKTTTELNNKMKRRGRPKPKPRPAPKEWKKGEGS